MNVGLSQAIIIEISPVCRIVDPFWSVPRLVSIGPVFTRKCPITDLFYVRIQKPCSFRPIPHGPRVNTCLRRKEEWLETR